MNIIKKIVFLLSLFAAVGITYTMVTLKNIPESFDWDLEETDNEDY
jgi:hypothetical protein